MDGKHNINWEPLAPISIESRYCPDLKKHVTSYRYEKEVWPW